MANDKVRFEFTSDSQYGDFKAGEIGQYLSMTYQDVGPLVWIIKPDGRLVSAHTTQLKALVSDDTNNSQVSNKSDTITISRAVAEEWLNQVMDIYDQCGNVDKPMVKSIRKALSEGRV